jgi:hypothetical protein
MSFIVIISHSKRITASLRRTCHIQRDPPEKNRRCLRTRSAGDRFIGRDEMSGRENRNERSKTYLKSHQAGLKGVNTLGHRVSIRVRSETVSEFAIELRDWTASCAGCRGQVTLERLGQRDKTIAADRKRAGCNGGHIASARRAPPLTPEMQARKL